MSIIDPSTERVLQAARSQAEKHFIDLMYARRLVAARYAIKGTFVVEVIGYDNRAESDDALMSRITTGESVSRVLVREMGNKQQTPISCNPRDFRPCSALEALAAQSDSSAGSSDGAPQDR